MRSLVTAVDKSSNKQRIESGLSVDSLNGGVEYLGRKHDNDNKSKDNDSLIRDNLSVTSEKIHVH